MKDCFRNLAELPKSGRWLKGLFVILMVLIIFCFCCRTWGLRRALLSLLWTPALMGLMPELPKAGGVPASGRGGGREEEMC